MTIIKKNIPNKNKTGSTTIINNNGGGITTPVIDNLESNSTTSALSANQGKILNTTKLSKTTDDTADGKITFNKGLLVKDSIKGDSTDNVGLIKTKNEWWLSAHLINGIDRMQAYNGQIMNNFTINKDALINGIATLGGGFKTKDYTENTGASLYQDAANKWNAIVDNLKVRGHLDVQTLQIEEVKAVGGKIVCTKAAFKIDRIGEDNNIYRCYFRTEDADGTKIYNQFKAGDLAFCQVMDSSNRVKRYWRYVTGARENFVDLSKSRCEVGSDVPSVGDEVVQLGSANDVSRQGALIIEPLAINVYKGINSFTLPTAVVSLNPFNSKIDAETINFLGKTLINNNFVVDKQGNLTIRGNIKANTGNIGNFTINERGLYNDIQQGKAEIEIVNSKDAYEKLSIGTKDNVASLDISNRAGDCLNCSTEGGVAIKAVSHTGHGLEANNAFIRGLYLNVANIKFDGDNEDRLINLDEVDIVKLGKAIKKPKTIVLPIISYNVGRRITIVNGSGISHKIISQTLENGLNEQLEYLTGKTPTINVDKGNGEIVQVFGFAIERYTAVELLNTGDAWTIINVYR